MKKCLRILGNHAMIPSSIRDRVAASRKRITGMPESKGREVMQMTTYETIMAILGILGFLVSFGGLLLALLNFLTKRKK